MTALAARTSLMGMDDVQHLRARISAIEAELSSVRQEVERLAGPGAGVPVAHGDRDATGLPVTASVPVPHSPPVVPDAQRPAPSAIIPKRDVRTWEFAVAGNILGKLGLLALILATAWFIKLAFDEQWINESGRIYTGLVCGFLTVVGGLTLAHRSYRILPPAAVGAGGAMLYVSVWGAHHYYDLIGLQEAFIFLVILGVATALLSYAGRSQVLYAFSLAGSMLAPILLSRGENSYRFLFGYLTLVNAGFLLLSLRHAWRVVPWLLFAANVILFSIWGEEHLRESSFPVPYAYVLGLFLFVSGRELLLVPRTASTFRIDEALLVVASGLFAALASFWLFDVHHPSLRPHGLLLIVFLAAGLFLLTDRWIEANPLRLMGKGLQPEFLLRSALLVLFLPALFAALTDFADGSYRTASWIAFAGTIGIAGALRRSRALLGMSVVAWLPAVIRLIFFVHRPDGFIPVWNARFAMHVLATLFLAAAYALQRKQLINGWMRGFVYAAMVAFILGVLRDNHDYVTDPHYRNLGYSYVLAAHAAVFLAAGFARSMVSWRRAGLALAAIVVLKLYLFDIWTMGRAVRIIAGFSLGAALVAVSILYNRFRGRIFPEEKKP